MSKIKWIKPLNMGVLKKEYQWTKAIYKGKTLEVGLWIESPSLFKIAFGDIQSDKENQIQKTCSSKKDQSLILQIEDIIMNEIDKEDKAKVPTRAEIEEALELEKKKLKLEEGLVSNTKKLMELHQKALEMEQERVFRSKGIILITEYSLHIDKSDGKCGGDCKECLNFISTMEGLNNEIIAHRAKPKGGQNEKKG